ncbi:FadR/GntR family transcriptional regulator [Stakelama pacifica]|uniref:GntR family transcriptional regulator n=1 Tax=Stakelama pacifica TaxID=517720 RepID=A0A4R6FAT3_9SPHN|nr:FadR/GntR family transcriptional regulator [Stakelama pacifica]MAW99405.1 GntR family transcriptional regulator [Sphingomonas sp.]TDN78107.1 GntR family transcriptional regulator [Stakelama pacifica]GGP00328.1 GntR family transcriptional regulator [Stakelama pacifica]
MTSSENARAVASNPEREEAARSGSLTDELFSKLEASIRSGELRAGTRLPSQKEIALSQNVSRTVVREAVARLTAQGLAVSRQGAGVFVVDTPEYRAFQITREEVQELADVIKLLEMRMAVETEMAGLAAARRTTQDIGAIQDALTTMITVADDPMAAASADAAFHLAISRATQNEYYSRFVEFLGVRLVPSRSLYLGEKPQEVHRAYADKVLAEHEAIVDAIIRMDSTRAREAARQHMHESLTRHSTLSATLRMAKVSG